MSARIYAAVYVTLLKEGKIFLLRRQNTPYKAGFWNFPAGHVEHEEFPTQAAARELKEEAGVIVKPEDLRFIAVQHRIQFGERTYADYFFTATKWEGEPHNAEPEKASEGKWFALNDLPEDLIPYHKEMFLLGQQGTPFRDYEEIPDQGENT